MLKGVPSIISPELMKVLMEMGHGDEIVLADANFPAVSNARRLVRCDGHQIPELLRAIAPFFPFDHSVEQPLAVMSILSHEEEPEVWDKYRSIVRLHDQAAANLEKVERFAYYERAKQAFAIVTTGDQSYKGNLILKKGVVREQ